MNISAQDVINAIFNPDDTVCLRIFDDRKEGIQNVCRSRKILCSGVYTERT